MIGIDGSDNHLLSPLGGNGVAASWLGDGTKVIFATDVEVAPGTIASKAMVVNVTGTPIPQLLLPNDPGGEYAPTFSPDGQWVIFRADYNRPAAFRYHIVKADGSTPPVPISDQIPIGDLGVVWSPDGNWFYFPSNWTSIYRASTDPLNQSWSVVTANLAEGRIGGRCRRRATVSRLPRGST